VLAWSQECTTREEALPADRQIKNWSRKKKEAMMRDALIEISAEVSRLAQSKSGHPSLAPPQGGLWTDERIYFYKALLREVERTLIEEFGFV